MEESRSYNIERLAGSGKLAELKELLGDKYTQYEIDIALSNAIAYSKLETAKYLIYLGADISWGNYDGIYYAVHNDELEGLKFSLSQGIDVNINNGMLLNTSIMTAVNSKDNKMVKWLLNEGIKLDLLSPQMKSVVKKYGNEELKNILKIN